MSGLTTTQCRNAQAKEKTYKLSDGHGLRLVVQPSGTKIWQLAYRVEGKHRTLTLGKFPVVDVKDARQAAYEALKKLAVNIDPAAEIRATSERKTFQQVAQEQFDAWKVGKVEAHVQRVWGRLEADAFPAIGAMKLDEIKPSDVVAMVRSVEQRGALDVSRRLRQKVSEVFSYAIAMGYCEIDPAAHVGRVLVAKPPVEHMGRVPESEIPALLASIETYPQAIVRLAVKWCLTTATRTAETREARWSEIRGDRWVIPAARMKMGREHIVPLAPQALELLKELKAHRRGDYLFPGPRRPTINQNAMIFALYDIENGYYRGKQTIHGFRGQFSTWANERGWNRDWVERQLAHVEESSVRGAYNAAEYMEGRVKLMAAWADQIDQWRFEGMMG